MLAQCQRLLLSKTLSHGTALHFHFKGKYYQFIYWKFRRNCLYNMAHFLDYWICFGFGSVLKSICGYIYYNSFFFPTCIESERGKVNWCNLIKSQCKCRDCQEISYASDFWHFRKKYWLSFSHLPGAGEWRNFWSNNLLCLYRFTEAFMNIAQSLLTLAAWYVITLFHTETRRANLSFCSKP